MGHRRIGSPTHCVTDFVGKKNLEFFCRFRPDHWVTGALGHRHIGSPTHWVTSALGHRRIGSPAHSVTGALSHRRIRSPARCDTDCRSCRDTNLVKSFFIGIFVFCNLILLTFSFYTLCVCPSVRLSVTLSVSLYLFVCMSVCLSV